MDAAVELRAGLMEAVRAGATPPSSDSARLARAAREGDRAAFGELYSRYARMVHGILLARVPRREVDDLVQDVFLLALRRLDGLRNPEAFGPWLAMITRKAGPAIAAHGRAPLATGRCLSATAAQGRQCTVKKSLPARSRTLRNS